MGVHLLKPTWTRGELSPLAHARPDTELYQQGAELIKNWFVLKEGGLRRRSGTKFRGEAKFHDKDTRFLDFKFSATKTFAVELGDGYARFWTKDGRVMDGLVPYEIASPYNEAALRSIQWVQAGNVLYIAHRSPSIKPQKLVRIADDDWEFQEVEFLDGPYLPINDRQNNAVVSGSPASLSTTTVTFDNTEFVNDGAGFISTDVGRLFRVQIGGRWSWGHITAVASTTSITVLWVEGNSDGGTSLSWRLGAFSDTTGYPGAVGIFQGRLFWAGNESYPRYYGYSYSGLPETFTPSDIDGTVTDANGGAGDIIAGDEILWLQEAIRIQIGTPSGVRSLGASDIDQTFGPRNATQKLEIPEGVSEVRPIVVGPSTVHCGRFATTINDLFYDYQINSLSNPELSVTAEHLVSSGVTELAFQQLPYRRLFAIADGDLICTTVNKYEKIVGWTSQDVSGHVVTMTSISGDKQHDLWMVVRRTINGVQKQYVETLASDFLRGSLEDAFFVDCGATYSGAATNTVSGATWLANTEVAILADGKVVPNQTVSVSGVLTLPNGMTATKIQYGLPIEARVKSLRAPTQTANGQSLGRRLKVVAVDVDLYETRGLKSVSDSGKIDELRERPASNAAAVNGMITGPLRLVNDGSWSGEGRVQFLANTPLPATIRAVNVHVVPED